MKQPYYICDGQHMAIENISFRQNGNLRAIRIFHPQGRATRNIINTDPVAFKPGFFNRLALCDPELEQNIIWEDN